MKLPSSFKSISLGVSSLSVEENIKVLDFHPDLFLPLFTHLPQKLFLLISNKHFPLVVKHLSVLWDNDSVVFVDGSSGDKSPAGFMSHSDSFVDRSRGLLSGGLGACRFIVCSESGFSVPVLGSGKTSSPPALPISSETQRIPEI